MNISLSSKIHEKIRKGVNLHYEFALLAFARIIEENIVVEDGIVCEQNNPQSFSAGIPPITQLKLLKYCKENDKIPVVIHSHVKYNRLMFSPLDTQFEMAMLSVSIRMNGSRKLLSLLLGRDEYVMRLWDEQKEDYVSIVDYEMRNAYEKVL